MSKINEVLKQFFFSCSHIFVCNMNGIEKREWNSLGSPLSKRNLTEGGGTLFLNLFHYIYIIQLCKEDCKILLICWDVRP